MSLKNTLCKIIYIDGLVQDCSNSIANALELLQSCIKPYIYMTVYPSMLVVVLDCSNQSQQCELPVAPIAEITGPAMLFMSLSLSFPWLFSQSDS